jgi:hypothetical protein
MIRIVDNTASSEDNGIGTNGVVELDRAVYNRLQIVPFFPLGSLPEDSRPPLSLFIVEMEKFYSGTPTANGNEVNSFLGSLGITQYYPHHDNAYKGELG